MSETHHESDSGKFLKRAAAVGLGLSIAAAGGKAVVDHIDTVNKDNQQIAAEQMIEENEKKLVEALAANYPESAKVGATFTLDEGEGYLDKSLEQIKNTYPDEYDTIESLAFNDLKTAAIFQVTAQAGGEYALVEADINDDGKKEFLPVTAKQIVYENIDSLPTPDTH